MALSDRQKKWLAAYLGEAKFNATEAARAAGYRDPEVSGWENKQKPEIQDAIARRLSASAMSADEVLAQLADQARGAARWIKPIGEGRAYLDVEQMIADGKGHLIKGVKYTDAGQCIIELHDGQTALIQLGRHHKLFTDKTETGLNDRDLSAIESLDRKLASLAARSRAASLPDEPDDGGGAGP